jgi:hypothetical protein
VSDARVHPPAYRYKDSAAQDRSPKESSLVPTRHDSCMLFPKVADQRLGTYILRQKLGAFEEAMIVVKSRRRSGLSSGTWSVSII